MHNSSALAGPVWTGAVAFMVLAFALAAFVAVDSTLPRRALRFAHLREPRLLYTIPAAAFALIALAVQILAAIKAIPQVIAGVAAGLAIASPFAVALGFAYLLRVVYPVSPTGPIEADDGTSSGFVAEGGDSAVEEHPATDRSAE